ncbi:Gfo/Idh/MocA family oxidoreductase [Shigella flexneri]
MLDAAMYVLGFAAVRTVTAHSFQEPGGTRERTGSVRRVGSSTGPPWKMPCLARLNSATAAFCRLDTSFSLNIREQLIMNVSFCGDKAGATLFPAHIYTDNNGELMTLMQREMADDNRHLRSMEAFINHVQGKPVMIADAEQGYIIQQLVAALYQSAETGTRVEL